MDSSVFATVNRTLDFAPREGHTAVVDWMLYDRLSTFLLERGSASKGDETCRWDYAATTNVCLDVRCACVRLCCFCYDRHFSNLLRHRAAVSATY